MSPIAFLRRMAGVEAGTKGGNLLIVMTERSVSEKGFAESPPKP